MSSIRRQILTPVLAASALSALGVALFSQWQGNQRALRETQQRFDNIQNVTDSTRFPLTQPVLRNIAQLTSTELVALTSDHRVAASTLTSDELPIDDLVKATASNMVSFDTIRINKDRYLAYKWNRNKTASNLDEVASVVVLLNESILSESQRQSASGPLLTGLSTLFILTMVAVYISNRMGQRMSNLQHQVQSIANGDFQKRILQSGSDEVSQLGQSVNSMAEQLQELWDAMRRQQKARTLHQLSGGLAHQLRNTLTGARLAIELHAQDCNFSARTDIQIQNPRFTATGNQPALEKQEIDDLNVAIQQLENAEATIQRLVNVGLGIHQPSARRNILDSIDKVRCNLVPVARHLNKDLQWTIDSGVIQQSVSDGASFEEAITNLILNAIEAGQNVKFIAKLESNTHIAFEIHDDGIGPPKELCDNLFDPFVTSRPEGLGLGLAQVRLACEHLKGNIQWHRENQWTVFVMKIPTDKS